MDCYVASVLGVKGTGEWITTIDTVDGRCITGKTWGPDDKDKANMELIKMKAELDVKLIPDDRGNKDALSKEERVWVHDCKLKNKEYKSILLKSRIERRRLDETEMK